MSSGMSPAELAIARELGFELSPSELRELQRWELARSDPEWIAAQEQERRVVLAQRQRELNREARRQRENRLYRDRRHKERA